MYFIKTGKSATENVQVFMHQLSSKVKKCTGKYFIHKYLVYMIFDDYWNDCVQAQIDFILLENMNSSLLAISLVESRILLKSCSCCCGSIQLAFVV